MSKTPDRPESDKTDIEESAVFSPRFSADGLIAAAAVDHGSGRLLMIAWMNEEALKLTIETGEAHYWSRSRQSLWRKGETSGHIQEIVELRTDCDQDAVQLIVQQTGPACHTNRPSCFYRRIAKTEAGNITLQFIETENDA